jgi:hypothetical protein
MIQYEKDPRIPVAPYTSKAFFDEHNIKSSAFASYTHFNNGYTNIEMYGGGNFIVPTNDLLHAQEYFKNHKGKLQKYIILTLYRNLSPLCDNMILESIKEMFDTVDFK